MRKGSDLKLLRANADEAADFVRLIANSKRLLVLCELMACREMSVGPLADTIGLSRSAMSQHLTKLRAVGIVETRRQSQTIFYRLSGDARARRALLLLKRLFRR